MWGKDGYHAKSGTENDVGLVRGLDAKTGHREKDEFIFSKGGWRGGKNPLKNWGDPLGRSKEPLPSEKGRVVKGFLRGGPHWTTWGTK